MGGSGWGNQELEYYTDRAINSSVAGGKLSITAFQEKFGNRDHTTVMHSCRQTEQMSESDPTIHEAIKQLRKELWKT